MINLFVEFGFQPLNMEALLDFELIERSCIINKFEARNITIIVTIFGKTKMLENMRIFIPEKVLIYTCVEMPVGFTNVAASGVRYVGETNRHFYTRENEHLFRDKNSHIFKHLSFSKNCHDNCDVSCFKIIDNATSFYRLKIQESFHIERLKLELNKQVDHVSLALHF